MFLTQACGWLHCSNALQTLNQAAAKGAAPGLPASQTNAVERRLYFIPVYKLDFSGKENLHTSIKKKKFGPIPLQMRKIGCFHRAYLTTLNKSLIPTM